MVILKIVAYLVAALVFMFVLAYVKENVIYKEYYISLERDGFNNCVFKEYSVDALSACDRFLQSGSIYNDDKALVYSSKAEMLVQNNDCKEAFSVAKKAVEVDSKEYIGMSYRARSHANSCLGDNKNALSDMTVAIGLNKTAAGYYGDRAEIEKRMGLNDDSDRDTIMSEKLRQQGLFSRIFGLMPN